MKRLLFLSLLFILPILSLAQGDVIQQRPVNSDPLAPNYNKQAFVWSNGYFQNTFSIPFGNSASWNGANFRNGTLFWRTVDSTFLIGQPDGSFVGIKSSGGGPGILYINGEQFKYNGSLITQPLSLMTDTIASGRVYHLGLNPGNLAARLDTFNYAQPSSLPNAIISGLETGLFINGVGDTLLAVNPGVWRINNLIYHYDLMRYFTLPARDATRSQYGYVYADAFNQISLVLGALSTTPVPPPIPANTVFVSSVLITPTGVFVGPTGRTIYTGDGTLLSNRTVFGGGHYLEIYMPNGSGGTDFVLDSLLGFSVFGKNHFFTTGGQLTIDSTQTNLNYVSPNGNSFVVGANNTESMLVGKVDSIGRFNTINYGTFTPLHKGISVQLDDTTAVLQYQTSGNETAIIANPLAIPDMNILNDLFFKHHTIYNVSDSLINNRTVFFKSHQLQFGDTTAFKALVLIDPVHSLLQGYAGDGTINGNFSIGNSGSLVNSSSSIYSSILSENPTSIAMTIDTVRSGFPPPLYQLKFNLFNNTAVFTDNRNHRGIEYSRNNYIPSDSTLITKHWSDYHITGNSTYNTVDQTTNYERFMASWHSNFYEMGMDFGGTGLLRGLKMGYSASAGSNPLDRYLLISNNNRQFDFVGSTIGDSLAVFTNLAHLTSTASTQLSSMAAINPTINQTSIAGYRGLWISPFEQALGSGVHYLIDAGTNSAANGSGVHSSKFTVDNGGNVNSVSVRATAVTFANLPASPVEGMMVPVTNSNTNVWGATIAGGGANHVLAYFNGTNWTVMGK